MAINVERQTFSTLNPFSYAMVYSLNLQLNLTQSLLLTPQNILVIFYTADQISHFFYYAEFFKNHYIPQLIIKYKLNTYMTILK